jgi:GGDEF domain-containing protein
LERIRRSLAQPIMLAEGDRVTLEPRIGVGVRQDDEAGPIVAERATQALEQARRDSVPSVVVMP